MSSPLLYQLSKHFSLVRHWVMPMFGYGFARSITAEYPDGQDLVSTRLLNSISNGFLYSTPYGVWKLAHIMDRVHIRWCGRDPSKYSDIYQETNAVNRRTVL